MTEDLTATNDQAESKSDNGEFERESVPEGKLLGLRNFIGMYAGEHTAGTEFMIGPLFVSHGVTVFDVLVGLLLGNLAAVLSWRFYTAPIAVRVRQTLYYQLERICGAKLVTAYNLANGIMFCFLAGAMISVSATAVGIPFHMEMPALSDWLPNSLTWIIVVIVIGFIMSIVGAIGYHAVARVANIAAPWMVLVFFACGLAALPQLGVHNLTDFWSVARESIWQGVPVAGQSKYTFGHVFFFAWFCNLAMHIGMSDLSILRFAKKPSYGFASAAGIYLGHYFAWIAAALLYSLQLKANASNTAISPGLMAQNIAGLTGIACVILAGWTTANPTMYRAGLALQIVWKKASRFTVTMVAGAIATIAGIFPALAMKLLDFVALYGLVLMPMGAVIFIDFWLLPKFGLKRFYAEISGISFNWAAGAAWIVTLCIALLLNLQFNIAIFFLALPGWFVASIIYVVGSKIIQKQALA